MNEIRALPARLIGVYAEMICRGRCGQTTRQAARAGESATVVIQMLRRFATVRLVKSAEAGAGRPSRPRRAMVRHPGVGYAKVSIDRTVRDLDSRHAIA
jgi:hypothetical protein